MGVRRKDFIDAVPMDITIVSDVVDVIDYQNVFAHVAWTGGATDPDGVLTLEGASYQQAPSSEWFTLHTFTSPPDGTGAGQDYANVWPFGAGFLRLKYVPSAGSADALMTAHLTLK